MTTQQKVCENLLKLIAEEYRKTCDRTKEFEDNISYKDIGTLCDYCRLTGKLSGLSEALNIVRDSWIDGINQED